MKNYLLLTVKPVLIALFFTALMQGKTIAQVAIDHPIMLTGSSAATREIQGIQTVANSQDAVNVDAIQKNTLVYAGTVTGSLGAYIVTLSPTPSGTTLTTGMVIQFIANSASGSPGATLTVSGGFTPTAVPILKNYNTPLSSGDIQNGQAVSVIFDGTNFQMLSQLGTAGTATTNMVFTFSTTTLKDTLIQGSFICSSSVTLNCKYVSGNAAPVSFQLIGTPAGVTWDYSPGGGYPDFTSILTLYDTPASPPSAGIYPITVTAVGGAASQQISFNLVVLGAGKRVFVTSTTYNGAYFGSAAGGDVECQSRANAASLGGTWKSFLSSSSSNAASRLNHYTGYYNTLGSQIIAKNWTSLTNTTNPGGVINYINVTELYTFLNNTNVWTGSYVDGTWYGSGPCNDWTSSSSGQQGTVGSTTYINWTSWAAWEYYNCNQTAPIYCFEQ